MSTPTDRPSPAEPAGTRPPSTQEIPVVAPAGAPAATRQSLPPHPDAAAPAPVSGPVPGPVSGPQPTGPVDFVPGPPGPGTPPVPPPPVPPAVQPTTAVQPAVQPAAPTGAVPPEQGPAWPDTLESDPREEAQAHGPRTGSRPRDGKALTGVGLAALALVLVLLGLTLDSGTTSFWSAIPLWSTFATLCALIGLVAFAALYAAGNRLRSDSAWRLAAAGLVGLAAFWLLVVLPSAATDRGFLLTAALAALGGALWIGPRTRV